MKLNKLKRVTSGWNTFTLLFVALLTPASGWAQEIEWIRQFGTSQGDRATGVIALNPRLGGFSSIYVVGQSFVPGISEGSFLKNYSPSGDPVWEVAVGTPGNSRVRDVSADASTGEVYVTGAKPHLDPSSAPRSDRGFIYAYDSNGAVRWFDELIATPTANNPNPFIEGNAIAFNRSSDPLVYVVGQTDAPLVANCGNPDPCWFGFVRAYSVDDPGTVKWTRQDFPGAVLTLRAVAGANHAYVAGEVSGGVCSEVEVRRLAIVTKRHSDNGDTMWSSVYTAGVEDGDDSLPAFCAAPDSLPTGIAVHRPSTLDGGVYVYGSFFSGPASPFTGARIDRLSGSPSTGPIFVRKHSDDGSVVWTRQYGDFVPLLAGERDYSLRTGRIAVDDTGVYISGTVRPRLLDSPNRPTDAFVAKIDFDGELIWGRRFRSPFSVADDFFQYAGGISANFEEGNPSGDPPSDSGVYVAGGAFEITNEPSFGLGDGFLAKVLPLDDDDGDGILNDVDTMPLNFSNAFDDGTTSGFIETRGDQILVVADASDPSEGVRFSSDIFGGPAAAEARSCGSSLGSFIDAGEAIVHTCGSATLRVITGPVLTNLFSSDGELLGTIEVPTGQSLTLEPTTGVVTAAAGNDEILDMILPDGTEIPLTPDSFFAIPHTVVLDFESLRHAGGTDVYATVLSYSEDGFTYTNSHAGGACSAGICFGAMGTNDIRFTGEPESGTALFNFVVGSSVFATLTNDNNDTFNLLSLDASEFQCQEARPDLCSNFIFGAGPMDYTGTKADGSTVTYSFSLDRVFGAEPITFPPYFSGLVSVSFPNEGMGSQNHQWDNVRLQVVPPETTLTGTNSVATPRDPTTLRMPATLTFTEVTQPGETSLAISSEGPDPPASHQLLRDRLGDLKFYDLTTTATFVGPIEVCSDYSGLQVDGDASALQLLHFEEAVQKWAVAPQTREQDFVNQVICGSVNSLSPFAFGEPVDNANLIINGCDTGVPQTLGAIVVSDAIAACGSDSKCVKALAKSWWKQSLISKAQRKSLEKCSKPGGEGKGKGKGEKKSKKH